MDEKVFEAYSLYYDLLYKDKDYSQEIEYVQSLIKRFSSGATNILELGCGTGIHASKLAEKGYEVTGIDKSETMLQRALKLQSGLAPSVSEKLSFLEGDIRTYESTSKSDVIISLFHVMSYMASDEDLNKAIQTAKRQLKQQGIFIFDCWHGPGVLSDKPVSRTKAFQNDAVYVKRTSIPELYPDKHLVDVNFEISIHDKLNNRNDILYETHRMRYLFTNELNNLMNINGLEILHTEEWLTGASLSEKSWNACYVCRNKI